MAARSSLPRTRGRVTVHHLNRKLLTLLSLLKIDKKLSAKLPAPGGTAPAVIGSRPALATVTPLLVPLCKS